MQQTAVPKPIPPAALFAAGVAAQILTFGPLWGHISDGGTILGRYTRGYALALALSVVIGVLWVLLLIGHKRVFAWLARRSPRLILSTLAISGLALFALWQINIESQLREMLSINWLAFAAVGIAALPDQEVRPRLLRRGLPLITLVFVFLMFMTALTTLPYSPDEAHWADYGTSPFVADGLYARTWLQEPQAILPGLGWSVAAYGWTLENIAFDIRVGRVWNFTAYLLAIGGIGLIAGRLYGRKVAYASVVIGLLSATFLPVLDYRPDHQLPLAMVAAFYPAVRARTGDNHNAGLLWHFLAGLLVTLSMQLHAAAVYLAMGLALYYLVEFTLHGFRNWGFARWDILLAFASGATLGTGLYFIWNIIPAGGLSAYLDALVGERYEADKLLWSPNLNWPSLLENGLILAGVAYMLWRRTEADKLLLSLLAAVLIPIILFDSWGYRTTYQALPVIFIAVLVVDGLRAGDTQNRRSWLLMTAVILMLAGQMTGLFIDWERLGRIVQQGGLPKPYLMVVGESVLPYIDKDDVVIASHELIWALQDRPDFYSLSAEITAMRRWGLGDPVAVWKRVHPTLIVDIHGPIIFPPGLQVYMMEENFTLCGDSPPNVDLYRRDCD